MNPSDHFFIVTGRQIAKAAKKKIKHHRARAQFWAGLHDDAINSPRKVLAPGYATRSSLHVAMADQLAIEAKAYWLNKKRRFRLNIDDLIRFGLIEEREDNDMEESDL